MNRTLRRFVSLSACACGVVAVGLLPNASRAASITYGNFGPVAPGFAFTGVNESSVTNLDSLYGPPEEFITGLDFDPLAFAATSRGDDADGTVGQLQVTVTATGLAGVDVISLFEAGNYSLAGVGTATTNASAGVVVRASVSELNGVAVLPIDLSPVEGSIGFSLLGSSIARPWSLNLVLDVGAQLLGLGYASDDVATKVQIVMDNTLIAVSQPGTVSYIVTTDFRIEVVPVQLIPEPGGMALVGCALCGIRVARRKRR